MKGFIEVKTECNSKKHLISVANIKYVCSENGIVYIALACVQSKKNKPWHALSIPVAETYDEVIAKIKEALEEK